MFLAPKGSALYTVFWAPKLHVQTPVSKLSGEIHRRLSDKKIYAIDWTERIRSALEISLRSSENKR